MLQASVEMIINRKIAYKLGTSGLCNSKQARPYLYLQVMFSTAKSGREISREIRGFEFRGFEFFILARILVVLVFIIPT